MIDLIHCYVVTTKDEVTVMGATVPSVSFDAETIKSAYPILWLHEGLARIIPAPVVSNAIRTHTQREVQGSINENWPQYELIAFTWGQGTDVSQESVRLLLSDVE